MILCSISFFFFFFWYVQHCWFFGLVEGSRLRTVLRIIYVPGCKKKLGEYWGAIFVTYRDDGHVRRRSRTFGCPQLKRAIGGKCKVDFRFEFSVRVRSTLISSDLKNKTKKEVNSFFFCYVSPRNVGYGIASQLYAEPVMVSFSPAIFASSQIFEFLRARHDAKRYSSYRRNAAELQSLRASLFFVLFVYEE